MTMQIDNILPTSDARRWRAHDCMCTRIDQAVRLVSSSRKVITVLNSIQRHPVPWLIDPDPGVRSGFVEWIVRLKSCV